ncbi:MAG: hypothetical protein QOF06_1533 [Solirubrobacterales bacterium]|jgi:hypothetical protein|nr:hypothetical protein [Solirubrobacterales bacterium]
MQNETHDQNGYRIAVATIVILLVVFGIAVAVGGATDSTQFQALAAASGAALIGLLAPSPAAKG